MVCVKEEQDVRTHPQPLPFYSGRQVSQLIPELTDMDSFASQFFASLLVLGNRLTPPSEAGIIGEPPHPPVLGLPTCRGSISTPKPPCQPLVLFCVMRQGLTVYPRLACNS